MERNHILTAIETVLELLPLGFCKTTILLYSHTFQVNHGCNWIPLNNDDDDDDDSEDY